MKWTHNKLAKDLSLVKGTIFINVPLGSIWLTPQIQIADVIVVRPSYTRFCVDIFEVKSSRTDFLKELRSGKWKKNLKHCHRFYFAITAGIAEKEEIPKEAGLLVRGKNGWATTKRATNRNVEIPIATFLSMLFYKQKTEKNLQHRRDLITYFKNGWFEYRKELKKLGKRINKALKYYQEKENLK